MDCEFPTYEKLFTFQYPAEGRVSHCTKIAEMILQVAIEPSDQQFNIWWCALFKELQELINHTMQNTWVVSWSTQTKKYCALVVFQSKQPQCEVSCISLLEVFHRDHFLCNPTSIWHFDCHWTQIQGCGFLPSSRRGRLNFLFDCTLSSLLVQPIPAKILVLVFVDSSICMGRQHLTIPSKLLTHRSSAHNVSTLN